MTEGEGSSGTPPTPTAETEVASIVERVWALESFDRPEDALAEVGRGLAEHPESAELLGSLAWLEFFYGDRERSEAVARETLAVRPDDWRGLTMLVENAVARGDYDAAEASARELVGHWPNSEGSHLALAHALAQLRKGTRRERARRHEEVRDAVAVAVELAPEHVDTLRRSSILLAIAGDERGSTDLLSRALALDPTNEDLLMLVAGSDGTSEVEGLRVLSGVLTENPQQREAARRLSDAVWARTAWVASFLLILLAGLLLYGYLVFQEGLETSHRQRQQIGGAFIAAVLGWVMLLVFVRRALPRGYLRRLYNAVWWVWIGIALAAVGFLGTLFLAFAFAARSLPTQYEMSGGYIGGLTATLAFVAWIVLLAEILIGFARFSSERRNRIFAADDFGRAAARAELRAALIGLALRGGGAIVLAFVPVFAAPIATRPEAAGAFAAVAVAVGLPPVLRVLLVAAQAARKPARPRAIPALLLAAALLVSAGGAAGAFLLAKAHTEKFDPPPTPWELEMQERGGGLSPGSGVLDELGDIDFEQQFEDLQRSNEELRERMADLHAEYEGAGADPSR